MGGTSMFLRICAYAHLRITSTPRTYSGVHSLYEIDDKTDLSVEYSSAYSNLQAL